jgi:signal transduction histidine kinase
MSHELRTPLNAVIGFSEIIKEAMLGDDRIDSYRGYATDIHESGCHLLSLINDILDMSKIEAGKLELVDETVDLADAIETSLRLVRERALQNGVDLVSDVPEDLPSLTADLRKIKQIAINLLSNAVKFTPAGGRVTVSACVRDDGRMILRVADTGIGIAEDDIETVLAPFGQADAGLNRQYEGTGLGLSLTKALAELHGGTLDIKSRTGEPDRGTTVDVVFPAARVIR